MSAGWRLRPTRRGLWVRSGANARLYPWPLFAVAAAFPVVLVVALVLATNRQSWFLAGLLNPKASATASLDELRRHVVTTVDNLIHAEPIPHTSRLATIELWVEQRALEMMQASIHRGDPALKHEPGGQKPYVRGRCRIEGGVRTQCQIAYRGHRAMHHWAVKPSLRIKLRKQDVREGRRYIELQRPEDIPLLTNLVPEAIGREQGLMTNVGDPVRVFINGRFRGVYLRTTRPGEPLCRMQGRLPGVFLKGDNLSRGKGPYVDGALWKSAKAWRVTGDDPQIALAQLAQVQSAVRRSPNVTARDVHALREALDTHAYARWAALMALVSGRNTDAEHNHLLFWSRYRGLLEPLVWDTNGYIRGRTQWAVNDPTNPIQALLLRDPRWVHARDQALQALVTGAGGPAAMAKRIDAALARTRQDLSADRLLGEQDGPLLFPLGSVRLIDAAAERVKAWVAQRHRYLTTYLSLARVHLRADPARSGSTRVQVAGAVAVRVTSPGQPPRLLYPGMTQRARAWFPAPQTYVVTGAPDQLTFENAVTGGPVTRIPSRAAVRPLLGFEAGAFPPPPTGVVRLGPGVVRLRDDLRVAATQRLVIAPGTTLRLDPGVSVFCRGPARLVGTQTAPIVLEPAGTKPWGCLGLLGPGTSGSILEHVRVSGGSIGQDRGARLSGMLSAYGSGTVTLRDCVFGVNAIGDDAVNLAQARVLVERCVFDGARADGLDLDRCSGTIRASRFANCGNDGIDLMACELVIEETQIENCRDKGISVGEGTRALVRGGRIARCTTGLQVKDASALLVQGTRLEANGVGVHAYAKKWSYGYGGAVALLRTPVRGSRIRDLSIEARSLALLLASPVGTQGTGAASVRTVDALPPRWSALLAKLEALGAQRPD